MIYDGAVSQIVASEPAEATTFGTMVSFMVSAALTHGEADEPTSHSLTVPVCVEVG